MNAISDVNLRVILPEN